MATEDLVVSSTTDTEDAMQAALMHGIEAPSGAPVLSIENDEPAKKPVEPKADEKPAEKKAEAKPAAETDGDKAEKPKASRPRREDFDSEDDWGDALMGHRARKRIDTLTYEREEARRRAEGLETRIAALEGGKPAAAEKPAEPAKEPKADDFETHEEWIAALVAHKTAIGVATALETERTKEAKADEGIQREEEFQKFIAQRAEARERYDDFDEVIKDNGTMKLSGVMNYVIMSSEVGNDISYYLATHRDEAARIYAMEGPAAIRAMGKLESKVEHIVATRNGQQEAKADDEPPAEKADEKPAAIEKPAAPKKKVSDAAEPIEPIGARSTRSTVPLEELPYSDYKAKRDRDELNRKKFRR